MLHFKADLYWVYTCTCTHEMELVLTCLSSHICEVMHWFLPCYTCNILLSYTWEQAHEGILIPSDTTLSTRTSDQTLVIVYLWHCTHAKSVSTKHNESHGLLLIAIYYVRNPNCQVPTIDYHKELVYYYAFTVLTLMMKATNEICQTINFFWRLLYKGTKELFSSP